LGKKGAVTLDKVLLDTDSAGRLLSKQNWNHCSILVFPEEDMIGLVAKSWAEGAFYSEN
jgi:hypothetical protein